MTKTIDFNDLDRGTVVDNEFASQGVRISAIGGSSDAMIFDTSRPTGNDHDLATSNLGNVLIISEDGDSDDPDDNARGGVLRFDFDQAADVKSLTFLDIEQTAKVKFYDANGALIATQNVEPTGDNGQAIVHFDVAGAFRMDVELEGSGAIDNLVFDDSTDLDGIVEGSTGSDRIDANYTSDPDGDRVDANDQVLPGENVDDDIIMAEDGDDLVLAGDGDDEVYGGGGDDMLCGQDGEDVLRGDSGNDILEGMNDDDLLFGGLGDDRIFGDAGNDTAFGGAGNDHMRGGSGDDVLYGDTGGNNTIRESLDWDLAGASDGQDINGFTQNTGNVEVSFTVVAETGNAETEFESDDQLTSGITDDGRPIDANSSLYSITNGDGNAADYRLDFSKPVENVSFRINDVDGAGIVGVKAFDKDGNPITVTLEAGNGVSLSDTDGVAGADTAESNGGYAPDTSPFYAVLVTIHGPVARIEIAHEQDGAGNSGINITDVYYDVDITGFGDDTINGGAGDDTIFGEAGNDVLAGGRGDDDIFGGLGNDVITTGTGADSVDAGAGADTIFGSAGDTIDGGAAGDDNDVLDLTGQGPFVLAGPDGTGKPVQDSNGNGIDGTAIFVDVDGNPTGQTISFAEIETVIGAELNRNPDAIDDELSAGEDDAAAVVGNVLGNDDDPDGDLLSVSAVNGDSTSVGEPIAGDNGGLIAISANGNVIFDPNGEFDNLSDGETATTKITYTISDEDGLTDTATVTVTVTGANDDPIAVADLFEADEDTTEEIGNVLDNDSDPDGDALAVGAVNGDSANIGQPVQADGGGLVTIASDGTVTFDPNGDFESLAIGETAEVTVDYTVVDPLGAESIETVTITVNGVNDGTVQGTSGRDVITPGYADDDGDIVDAEDNILPNKAPNDDVILAGGGDDSVLAGAGDDTVFGGEGADTIAGGSGQDQLFGGAGSDTFFGGNGGDTVVGGEDVDGNDIDVLDLTGSNVDFITYDDDDPETGVVTFLDGSTMTFSEIENVIPCFTPGTTIATPKGERLVEDLKVGDRVITRDNGIQEIAWVGHKPMDAKHLSANPHLKPILIVAGALGDGLPERDILVSPNHRILVASEMTQLYFEEREVLAAAKHMTGAQGVYAMDVMATTYIHFMFDRHEVVLSNGAWTESFQPGDYSLKGIGNSQRNEIFDLFPELATKTGLEDYQSARRALKKHETKLLMK